MPSTGARNQREGRTAIRAIRDKVATRAQPLRDRVGYARVATDPEREGFQRAARARRRG